SAHLDTPFRAAQDLIFRIQDLDPQLSRTGMKPAVGTGHVQDALGPCSDSRFAIRRLRSPESCHEHQRGSGQPCAGYLQRTPPNETMSHTWLLRRPPHSLAWKLDCESIAIVPDHSLVEPGY